jgi:hypothetical protein
MEQVLTSKLVERQLPEFVRSEHPVFVTFLQKYYEWLETNNQVSYEVNALKNSIDLDKADDDYLNLIKRDLMPYFPENILADKRLFLKLITNFYKSNGTPDSVKFLFRALYNENIDIYYPKDDILKASDGKWVLPLALRIDTDDNNIFNIEKTKITGRISKATAIVEKVIQSVDRQLGISYIEVYVSNIQRLFETGETIDATYNNGVVDVTVSGRLIGALSEIKIDPLNRGLYYNGYDPLIPYNGDPVTIVGGLNPTAETPIGAVAYVGNTTKGSVTDIILTNPGFGFRKASEISSSYDAYVSTVDFKGGFENAPYGSEAKASINLLDTSTVRKINLRNMSIETLNGLFSTIDRMSSITTANTLIGTAEIETSKVVVTGTGTFFARDVTVGDTIYFGSQLRTVNAISSDTSLNVTNIFTSTSSGLTLKKCNIANVNVSSVGSYQSFSVYPLSFVTLDQGGGGYRAKPTVDTYSFYNEDYDDVLVISSCNIVKDTNIITDLTQDLTTSFEIGNYVRLYIVNKMEDIFEITGVTTHTITFANNFINDISGVSVYKIVRNDLYKIGSLGRIVVAAGGSNYAVNQIITFNGGSGYGANAYVSAIHPGNSGIKTVTINNHSSNAYVLGGEGYRRDALPTLVIQTVSGTDANVYVSEVLGDGEQYSLTTSRIGAITSVRVVSYGYDYVESPTVSLRNMDLTLQSVTSGQLFVSNTRVYQGTSNTVTTFSAYVDHFDQDTGFIRLFDYNGTFDETETIISDDGTVSGTVLIGSTTVYGDGRAKATAKFENGLIRYPGIYLNTDGHISEDKFLQDGNKFHNFSYVINSKTDYNKFKKPLNDIVHPLGTKTFVTRIDNNQENVAANSSNQSITIVTLPVKFDIVYGANATTNTTTDLTNYISVGDVVTFTGVKRHVANTVNVTSGSNTVYGKTCNFINDILDGDIISINTNPSISNPTIINETVLSVSNTNYLITQNTIGVTAINATINLYFDETKTVTLVNATHIKVDTKFTSNTLNIVTNVLKVK